MTAGVPGQEALASKTFTENYLGKGLFYVKSNGRATERTVHGAGTMWLTAAQIRDAEASLDRELAGGQNYVRRPTGTREGTGIIMMSTSTIRRNQGLRASLTFSTEMSSFHIFDFLISLFGVYSAMLRLFVALFCFVFTSGCDNMDLMTATDAGMDAVKAIALSDKDVLAIASKSADLSDKKNRRAPPGNEYSIRLNRIVNQKFQDNDIAFNYGVYISPAVNAFAMADGSIRIYSGLMDLLNDGELRFVIGHEMGHIRKRHIRKKIQLAYAASAVRKGIASQNNTAGEVARSVFGGLAESLMNAQFSQLEEKEADDYGLLFLKNKDFELKNAVSALKKLANLGKEHSFLSSHPDPDKRAERLQDQLEGRALPIEKNKEEFLVRLRTIIYMISASIKNQLLRWNLNTG